MHGSHVPKKSPIYTRTGDDGITSLLSGIRVPKFDSSLDAIGDVDELNCHVGAARFFCDMSWPVVGLQLEEIQSRLLDVGSSLAIPQEQLNQDPAASHRHFPSEHVQTLESWIDELDEKLPKLTNFILPSGCQASIELHVCRAVCRRAERRVSELFANSKADRAVLRYLNRLSDYFFVVARYCNACQGKTETIWKAHRIVKKT